MREGQAKVLNEAELKRVYAIAGVGRHGLRNISLVDFSFLLGLRVKELAALRIDDVVDSENRVLNSFHLRSDQAKGNKGRQVFLTNKKLRKNLNQYLQTRVDDPCRTLFKSQKTNFTPNSLQQLYKKLYDQAGIKGAKSHSGRRTFCTKLIQKGFDIKSVSVLMGHRSVQTTARYIDENPIKLAEMVSSL